MHFDNLTQEEANAIVVTISNLPNHSNTYMLHQKLLQQFTEQQNEKNTPVVPPVPADS